MGNRSIAVALAMVWIPLAIACQSNSPRTRENVWTEVSGGANEIPFARRFFAVAYDSNLERTLLFGGLSDGGNRSDIWSYESATETWTELAADSVVVPSPRNSPLLAYDEARERLVLYGGITAGAYVVDTWEFDVDSETWTEVALEGSERPPVAPESAMAYDAARDTIVLFGRSGSGGETWEFDSAGHRWVQVALDNASPPVALDGVAMTYDAAREKMVLLGQADSRSETWEYDGERGVWSQVALDSPAVPAPRSRHALVYDATTHQVLVFGGYVASGNPPALDDETWAYDSESETWSQIAVGQQAPSPHSFHQMVFDEAENVILLFGGETSEDSSTTEIWEFR